MDINDEVNKKIIVSKQSVSEQILKSDISLPIALFDGMKQYPENNRRPVNKTVYRNNYFQLTYSLKENDFSILSRGDIIYSTIPYDTSRNYIQRAVVQALKYPEKTREYIEIHKSTLETYIRLGIFGISQKRVSSSSIEVQEAYNQIFQDPIFEMQILGRLMQHNETGVLSANLASKFLYSENLKTGTSAYILEYIQFILELIHTMPVSTNGVSVNILKMNTRNQVVLVENTDVFLNYQSNITQGVNRLPHIIKTQLKSLEQGREMVNPYKPVLRSESGNEIVNIRKNYTAQSIHPKFIEHYFDNVLPIENNHKINVVSDVHSLTGKVPFKNTNYNILCGDISNSDVTDSKIKGLYIIGNHELSDIIMKVDREDSKWDEFREYEWFKLLISDPNEAAPLLPLGNHKFYKKIQEELAERFPKMTILNNESIMYKNIRYIGLTIPVVLVRRKKELQEYIYEMLQELLEGDYSMPTVILSHAPLFNELNLLSTKSSTYRKEYFCSYEKLSQIFKDYNIIGVIHGHHHIPASSGRHKVVQFVGKELFVVCSIYSNINTGFELQDILPKVTKNKQVTKVKIHLVEDPIQEIKGLYQEDRKGKTIYRVDKIIKKIRYRESFETKQEAIDYLNSLNNN